MSREQVAFKSKINMLGTGIVGMMALVGAIVLFAHHSHGFGLIWWLMGLVNIGMFAINLRIYRRATDT